MSALILFDCKKGYDIEKPVFDCKSGLCLFDGYLTELGIGKQNRNTSLSELL
jgi:hypothetical protein